MLKELILNADKKTLKEIKQLPPFMRETELDFLIYQQNLREERIQELVNDLKHTIILYFENEKKIKGLVK